MVNRFVLNGISYHGAGAIKEIPGIIKSKGFQKAFVASDPDLVKFGVTAKVTELLDAENLAYEIYSDIKPNPTIENVKAGVAAYKASGADYMITIGGGSSMDTGKAIGIIINNPEFEDVRSLEGVAPTKNKTVYTIAVPTTAGTAAEATINYVITDVEKKRKFVCVDVNDIPDIAIVDPEMMSSMPKGLTASTGMDALTHAIEGYTTKAAWRLADCLNLEAIKLIAENLRGAVNNTPDGREGMALGQFVTGMAFSNAGLGMVHAMAHALGGMMNLPHGVCNAVLLPYVMEFNGGFPGISGRFRKVAYALGIPLEECMKDEEAVYMCTEYIRNLSRSLSLPGSLKELSIEKPDFEAMADAAMKDSCMEDNYVKPEKHQVIEVYQRAFMNIINET